MTLYEIVCNRNNLLELRGYKDIEKDLLKSSIQALEEELIDKVINILAYRKELLQEEKTRKLEELEEYLQYCLYIARIDFLDLDIIKIDVNIPDRIIIKEELSDG